MSSDEELSDQDGEPGSNADPGVCCNDACCLFAFDNTMKIDMLGTLFEHIIYINT